MKVLMISGDSVPNPGGIASHVDNLITHIIKKGVECDFIGCYNNRYKMNYSNILCNNCYHYSISDFRILAILQTIYKQNKALRKIHNNNYDIIHIHNMYVDGISLFGIKGKFKRILTNHSSGFIRRHKSIIHNNIFKKMFSEYDSVISPSIEIQEMSKTFIHENKSHFIPNGVSIDKYKPGRALLSKNIEDNIGGKLVIFTSRRLVEKNGILYLLKSIPILLKTNNNFIVLIAGDGPEKERYKAFINANSLENSIFLLGNIQNDEIVNYYNRSDIFVLPSLMEATSISCLEAMACGLPIIGTNVGGIPFLVKNNINGFIINPANEFEIARYLHILIHDIEMRKAFAKKSIEIVKENFTWDNIAQKTIDLYKSIL